MAQVPPTLDYQGREPRPPEFRPKQSELFVVGLFGGFALSTVLYTYLGRETVLVKGPGVILWVGVIKLIVGLVLGYIPRWSGLGAGLLVSIPVAILVLTGLCFGLC